MGRGRLDRYGARGSTVDQPADLAAGDRAPARRVLHAVLARLGSLARPGPGPAIPSGVRPVQMARLVGFRHRCPRRYRLPLDGRVVLDVEPRLPVSYRSRIDEAVQRDRTRLLADHLRVPGQRQSPRGEGRLARWQPLPAAAQGNLRSCRLAVRYEWTAVDRRFGQAGGGDLRRESAAAR